MLRKRDIRFFEIAEKVSYLSDHEKHRHGAVITYKGRLIGLGKNSMKSHPKSPDKWSKTIHAELAAILNSKQNDFRGHEIYVFRRNKKGVISESKPCENCMGLIKSLKFAVVHYSSDNCFKSVRL